jgi:hypothetical protein
MPRRTVAFEESRYDLDWYLQRLDEVRRVRDGEYFALCPCHEDSNPSLHITLRDEKILMHCFACSVSLPNVREALEGRGGRRGDTSIARAQRENARAGKSKAQARVSYPYAGSDGRTYVKHRRGRGKGKKIWWDPAPEEGIVLSLYGDLGEKGQVDVVESEEDVNALLRQGTNAVTAGGAGSFRPEHARELEGRDVRIWLHRDAEGARDAKRIAQMLAGLANSVRIVESFAGKDADEHLSAGYGVDDARDAHYIVVPQVRILEPLPGGDAILNAPAGVESFWGDSHSSLWACGEPFMLVGPQGVGKTTLMQQIVLARVGVRDGYVLGFRVALDERPVLYIAADRASQARRSFARMVSEDDRDLLNERLMFWKGPPPVDAGREPDAFFEWVVSSGCSTCIIDSLKDIAADLSKDETGSRVNIAFQRIIANGVEIGSLHHQRKATAENKKPKSLSDVYGSTWLTSGHGSVVLLWGAPGDLVVELSHLKQPAEIVGPLDVLHDHELGESRVLADGLDVRVHFKKGEDVTVRQAAKRLSHTDDPTRNEIEQARRKLTRLVREGKARVREGSNAGTAEKIYSILDANDLDRGSK